MKRDMDLVRAILLTIDGASEAEMQQMPAIEGWTAKVVQHHVGLLAEAGYLRAEAYHDRQNVTYMDVTLTWSGHDFLDTVRDSKVWKKTKEGAAKVGGLGVKMLLELAAGYAKTQAQSMGLPIA